MREKQKDNLADFFYKLAEYSFVGLVVSGIVTFPKDIERILSVGLIGTLTLAGIGFYLDGLKIKRLKVKKGNYGPR